MSNLCLRDPQYTVDINLPFQLLTATLQSGHFMSIIQPFCVQFQPDFRTSGLTENFFQLTTTMNYDHLFGPLKGGEPVPHVQRLQAQQGQPLQVGLRNRKQSSS